MTGILRACALFLALGAFLNAEPNTPTITSAVPNFATNPPRLTITGTEFGAAPATVQLNSVPVSSIVSQTQTTIVCTFSSSLAPGTYLVTVTNNDTGKHATASVAITIGAVGPAGPPGPQGPAGPAAGVTFEFAPFNRTFTVPQGVTRIQVEAWGAGGGASDDQLAVGGAGGYARALLSVNPGDTYTVVVGGGGKGKPAIPGETDDSSAGFGGGGSPAPNSGAGGGGGATYMMQDSTSHVVIAAGGGGGGGGANGSGGMGGGAGFTIGGGGAAGGGGGGGFFAQVDGAGGVGGQTSGAHGQAGFSRLGSIGGEGGGAVQRPAPIGQTADLSPARSAYASSNVGAGSSQSRGANGLLRITFY